MRPVDLARTRGQEGDNDKVAEERGGSANTQEAHSCSENQRHFCLREASHFEVAVRGHVGRPAAGLPTAMRGFLISWADLAEVIKAVQSLC